MRIAWVALAVGCGVEATPEFYVATAMPEPIPLAVWAPPAYEADVLTGCAVWGLEGVACEAAPRETADVFVEVDETPCGDVHGRASDDGELRVYGDCIDSDRLLWSIVAHEIGHQLGIFAHVWPDCETVDDRDPRAPPVCGPAVMNPYDTTELARLTVADHDAFVARNPCLGFEGCANDGIP